MAPYGGPKGDMPTGLDFPTMEPVDSASSWSESGASQGWVGIAANAHSGIGSGRKRVERLVQELELLGLSGRVAWTPESRSTLVANARADKQCRCLVAAGGDGTVAALVNERPVVPVTVLRAGTENLFAHHFGMSARPRRVAAMIAAGCVAQLDLGQTNGRRFALMAGIGFDADVVTRHHLARLGRAGVARPTNRAAYVEPVLRSSFEYRFPPLTVSIADAGREEELVGTTVFIFNLPRYALGLPIAPAARGDDGRLDLVIFRNAGPLNALRYLWMVWRGIHLKRGGVEHRRVCRLSVTCPEPVPVQLDGDPAGTLAADARGDPWTVEVLPRDIDVMVPASYLRQARAVAHVRE